MAESVGGQPKPLARRLAAKSVRPVRLAWCAVMSLPRPPRSQSQLSRFFIKPSALNHFTPPLSNPSHQKLLYHRTRGYIRASSRWTSSRRKMATCKFGADQRRLQGEARDAFLKKCMEDRGRSARPSACRSRQRAQAIEKPAANREQRIRIKRAITCACAPVAATSCDCLGRVQAWCRNKRNMN